MKKEVRNRRVIEKLLTRHRHGLVGADRKGDVALVRTFVFCRWQRLDVGENRLGGVDVFFSAPARAVSAFAFALLPESPFALTGGRRAGK